MHFTFQIAVAHLPDWTIISTIYTNLLQPNINKKQHPSPKKQITPCWRKYIHINLHLQFTHISPEFSLALCKPYYFPDVHFFTPPRFSKPHWKLWRYVSTNHIRIPRCQKSHLHGRPPRGRPRTHRIHGCLVYLTTCGSNWWENVVKYTSPMDPPGLKYSWLFEVRSGNFRAIMKESQYD